MRSLFAAAVVLSTLTTAPVRAADLDLREEGTGFRMRILADARICVAFPMEKRGGDCSGLDLTRVRQNFSGQSVVVLYTDSWSLGVTMVPESSGIGGGAAIPG